MIKRLKDIAAFLALTAVLLAVLTCVAALAISPLIARDKSAQALQIIGLDTRYLPAAQKSWGGIVYNDAPLDKDNISSVKTIIISYNPFAILLSKKLSLISFKNLGLFGNWNPGKEQPLGFSGWALPAAINSFSKIPAAHVRFTDAQISVLTPDMGGLTLAFDFEGGPHGQKLEFQSHLKSAQKFISFSAGANGVIGPDFSNIDIDLDQGKFEVPDANARLSRVYGWVNYTNNKAEGAKVLSELNAGGLTLLGLPWQAGTASLDIETGSVGISGEAKSVGVEGIELALDMEKHGTAPFAISGSLHAEKGKNLADYLKEQTIFTLPAQDIEKIKPMQDVTVNFIYDPPGAKLQYRIGDDEAVAYRDLPLH